MVYYLPLEITGVVYHPPFSHERRWCIDMSKKVVVLIDGGYFDTLNYYLQENRDKRLGVEKLSLKVCEGMDHIRTKFYHANPYKSEKPTKKEIERYSNAQKFQDAINKTINHEFVSVGRVRPLHLHCPKCKGDFEKLKQKGVDVGIALDLVRMSRKKVADVFILISGDEDFAAAVEMAQEQLCNVIVYFCSDSSYGVYVSSKLTKVASNRKRMDLDFLEECAID